MKTVEYLMRYNFEHPEFCNVDVTIDDYAGDGFYAIEDGTIVGGPYTTELDAKDSFLE
jgi:hypothetical protein